MYRATFSLIRWMLRLSIAAVVLVTMLIVTVLTVAETAWGKERLRRFIVAQANQYLTATLAVGRVEGSLLRGIALDDVQISQDGRTLVSIERMQVSYTIGELAIGGTTVRSIALTRPVFDIGRLPDGRWDIASIVRRDPNRPREQGPRRPIHLPSVEIDHGAVTLRSPFTLGIARLSTEYRDLDLQFAFDYEPGRWQLDFARASWLGRDPDLTMRGFQGRIASDDMLRLDGLKVVTAHSALDVDGTIDRKVSPSVLDIDVDASRFDFQEWADMISAVRAIGVEASFQAKLEGPTRQLRIGLKLDSNGGNVNGPFVVDTTAPGWAARGRVVLARFDVARWFTKPGSESDVSGALDFDITTPPGASFPRGRYEFDGTHTLYAGYEADDVKARGSITATDVLIDEGTATAYGANVVLSRGSIGIAAPFTFTFGGIANGVDLRQLPKQVPVPHVESTLRFEYDVAGQFRNPFLRGEARFLDSEFLRIAIGAGTVGTIDTSVTPFHYSGEGDLGLIDLNYVGRGLDIEWMQAPRYAGNIEGHFHVDGSGADAATMRLSGGGQLTEAHLFDGVLSNADVSIAIADGSMTATYRGALTEVDAALAMDDPRYESRLTGSADARFAVDALLLRSPQLSDYTIDAHLDLTSSKARGVAIDQATVDGRLAGGGLDIASAHISGPAIQLDASGHLALDAAAESRLTYDITRADLAQLQPVLGREASGLLATSGSLTGPAGAIRVVGKGSLGNLDAAGLRALTASLDYDLVARSGGLAESSGRVEGTLTFVEAFNQQLQEVTGSLTFERGHVDGRVTFSRANGLAATVAASLDSDPALRRFDIRTLAIDFMRTHWQLAARATPRALVNEQGFEVRGLSLVDTGQGSQHIAIDGTWLAAGGGTMNVIVESLSLDALSETEQPARYGGTLTAHAAITGSRDAPKVAGDLSIVDGRVWNTAFERLEGRLAYEANDITLEIRLDQSPSVWLTANGRLPSDIATLGTKSTRPMQVALRSSTVSLGLLEGATNVVRNVTGSLQVNVDVVGTPADPHVDGSVVVDGAGFLVSSSGARYKNGAMRLALSVDRVLVERLHIEDADGQPLDVTGALATHELRVSELHVDAKARGFEVLRNEYGRMGIDADVELRGRFESPRLAGRISVARGELQVDSILDRTLFRPYSTAEAVPLAPDAVVALNPWDRLGLDIELHVPNSLRMIGNNLQVSPGTPLGLGGVNLRALGDLYLYKDPAQPLYVTGSLDQVTGTYVFQGRRFDLDPSSSITFRGDFDPELFVVVDREISGVVARVTIAGALSEPALRLSSTPPLDASDILSLIVFNTSTNQLTTSQQQQLAVRAGTLAAGFLAAPVLSAIEQSLGLDTLEIAPSADPAGGARVTIGNEIAPGLVARFSRQFGESEYDEAQIEYYLSRLFRIRATFSDASPLDRRSQFRRIERAGIDFLVFFSF